jgi:ABC-type transporter Mla maintaining outer membrane lipid asymmetry ATPase subunit MlaF
MDPSDVARRVVESNLRGVWRGSQWVTLSVCVNVCMYVYMLKIGGIVGGVGTNKTILLCILTILFIFIL